MKPAVGKPLRWPRTAEIEVGGTYIPYRIPAGTVRQLKQGTALCGGNLNLDYLWFLYLFRLHGWPLYRFAIGRTLDTVQNLTLVVGNPLRAAAALAFGWGFSTWYQLKPVSPTDYRIAGNAPKLKGDKRGRQAFGP
jgi:hypothetical protein